MNVANLLTASRLATVPLMLLSAWWQRPALFFWLLVYAGVSDVLDGPLARRLGQASTLGARLDSVADAAVYLTTPAAALVVYPVLRQREWLTLLVILVAYVAPIAIGYLRFRRLTAYHTIAARTAVVLLAAALAVFVALGITWPFRVAAGVLVLSALEEIALTTLLPEWRANVPSLLHVRRQRGGLRTF